jgi:hypothetical protein
MNQPKRLQFTLPLQVTELLRPFPMTTDEYGKKWGTFAQPNKIRKTVQVMVSIQQLVHFMQSQLNLHHIQTIRTCRAVWRVACGVWRVACRVSRVR